MPHIKQYNNIYIARPFAHLFHIYFTGRDGMQTLAKLFTYYLF